MSQVFLSCSREDKAEAAAICESLRHTGLHVWWEEEAPRDKNWAIELGCALEASDSMVLLVSPASVASDLVRRELDYARSSERLRTRLFLALIQPTWVVPWFFRHLRMFDLTKNRTLGLKRIVQAIKGSQRPAKAASSSA